MKICLINNVFSPYTRGGSDRIAKIIVDNLIKRGHEIFIISTRPHGDRMEPEGYKIFYINSRFFGLNRMPKFFRFFWHLGDVFNFVSYFRIKAILKKEKPMVVLTHNLKGMGCTAPRAIKAARIKHIHTLHDIQLIHPSGLMHWGQEKKINSFFARVYSWISAWFFQETDVVISPSHWLLKEHEKRDFFSKSKKIVLPNPVILPQNEFLNTEKSEPYFVFVGEIEAHKGAFLVAKAFVELARKNIDEKIIFIGQGSGAERLAALAISMDNIQYFGKMPNESAQKIIKNSIGLIMASTCYENSPTVIYEASALGVPVISSRIGGATELVRYLGGYLFTPQNLGDLLKKIIIALRRPEDFRQIGLKSRKKIKKYAVDGYISELEKLF